MDQKQEQGLIRAAQKGDRNALGSLYDAYADNIYRYFYFRLHDQTAAEDLTAEVFLNFVERLPTYEIGDTPLLVWLYKVAHARLVDYFRRQTRANRESNLDDLDIGIEDDADSLLMTDHHHEKLQIALDTLTAEQKQVIIFRFIEGRSLQATADLMGKTAGAIKVMQYRALQALNRSLNKQGINSR